MREERIRVLYCPQWKNFVKKVAGSGSGEGKDPAPVRTFGDLLSAPFAPGAVFLKLLSSSSKSRCLVLNLNWKVMGVSSEKITQSGLEVSEIHVFSA